MSRLAGRTMNTVNVESSVNYDTLDIHPSDDHLNLLLYSNMRLDQFTYYIISIIIYIVTILYYIINDYISVGVVLRKVGSIRFQFGVIM